MSINVNLTEIKHMVQRVQAAIVVAATNGHMVSLEALLDTDIPPPSNVLVKAVLAGQLDTVDLLLRHGVPPRNSHYVPLWMVCKGNVAMLRLLVKHGMDTEAERFPTCETSLVHAVLSADVPWVVELVRCGADAWSFRAQWQRFACTSGHLVPPLAQRLLDCTQVPKPSHRIQKSVVLLGLRGIEAVEFYDVVIRFGSVLHERFELCLEYTAMEPRSSHTRETLAVLPIAELRAMVDGHPSKQNWDALILSD